MQIYYYHYNDVIMGTIASQITSLTMVYSIVDSGADQRKYQSSVSLAFVREIYRWPVNSPHKWPVTREIFPFDDTIMYVFKIIKKGNVNVWYCTNLVENLYDYWNVLWVFKLWGIWVLHKFSFDSRQTRNIVALENIHVICMTSFSSFEVYSIT